MKTLSTEYRRLLKRTVIEARDIAEAGSQGALEVLAVQHHEPYGHMDGKQRTLRRRLRARARQLGDRPDAGSGGHGIDHLVHECAYEYWHGMLFARFLAENHLLMEPEMSVAITLDECEELAKGESVNKWVLAARFAHGMLPQIFRPDHPVFEVQFAREHRLKLEGLVDDLPVAVFMATDSLGWVYQFWQAKRKDEVNRSEAKIGADELPAVTQLFTEPYMVQFLLHNSLGAWWVSRHPDKVCPVDLIYLRRTEDRAPAASGFEGWPDSLSEFRLLDPCCGSGHFLVAAFLILVPMRMAAEDLDVTDAVDAVLRENIHGLELDQRCVAIAAFALALEAWRLPGAGSFRTLPKLNLAWCGQPVAGTKEQWLMLANGDFRLEAGMMALYDTFRDAPTLGSLINPARSVSEDILTAGFGELQPLLEKALREHAGKEEWKETAIAALGLADATRLLSGHYHLVVTNVPYLARGKQSERLRTYTETWYPNAKNDLANVFLERCLEFSQSGGAGVTQNVMPQNWLFLKGYKAQREHLLKATYWNLVVRLGPGAFETISGEVVNIILLTLTRTHPHTDDQLRGIDASAPRTASGKAEVLRWGDVESVNQKSQLGNPDARVTQSDEPVRPLLSQHADALVGLQTGDDPMFVAAFWELDWSNRDIWEPMQATPDVDEEYAGQSWMVRWERGEGLLLSLPTARPTQGLKALGKPGVAIHRMRVLLPYQYSGQRFHQNVAVIVPENRKHLPAIWCFCSSSEYSKAVRRIDQKLNVTNATLVKVPFDLDYWIEVAAEKYPNGLPMPYSNDPTQWIFHGHPCGSVIWDKERKRTVYGPLRTDITVLHIAVARLLGYRWPTGNDTDMELADEQREWVRQIEVLHPFEDEDGIVCIPSVRGEQAAQERLLPLLQASWGDDWRDGILAKLLADAGNSSLDDWLRNQFFDGHSKLFQQRPFIWHVWDGRKRDGFHALVNYHKLAGGGGKGRRLLESLAYSYLGDWISRQQDGVKRGEGGAEDRLAAAMVLQKRLVAILKGDPPFDIFVRCKPAKDQAIGWEPDINDGVRLNIRPFMVDDITGGKKGAGILRAKPNVHWKTDRGREPVREEAQYPWFWENDKFIGKRVNDVHLTISEKRTARERAREKI